MTASSFRVPRDLLYYLFGWDSLGFVLSPKVSPLLKGVVFTVKIWSFGDLRRMTKEFRVVLHSD